jgi:hypothetical protein
MQATKTDLKNLSLRINGHISYATSADLAAEGYQAFYAGTPRYLLDAGQQVGWDDAHGLVCFQRAQRAEIRVGRTQLDDVRCMEDEYRYMAQGEWQR